MFKGLVLRFVFVYSMPVESKRAGLEGITNCLKAGRYTPAIGARFAFSDIARAHDAQESGTVIGKILVNVSE